jgi:hypothetical protein
MDRSAAAPAALGDAGRKALDQERNRVGTLQGQLKASQARVATLEAENRAQAAHLQDRRTIAQAVEGLTALVRELRQELAVLRLEADDSAARLEMLERRP